MGVVRAGFGLWQLWERGWEDMVWCPKELGTLQPGCPSDVVSSWSSDTGPHILTLTTQQISGYPEKRGRLWSCGCCQLQWEIPRGLRAEACRWVRSSGCRKESSSPEGLAQDWMWVTQGLLERPVEHQRLLTFGPRRQCGLSRKSDCPQALGIRGPLQAETKPE